MKNVAAILLLVLFLFNFVGYRICFYFAGREADSAFRHMVDQRKFRSDELTTFALPLDMPYIGSRPAEKVEGEIEIRGRIYKYVSREIRNDSLILECLVDPSRTELNCAKTRILAHSFDMPSPEKKTPDMGKKNLPDSDYDLLRKDFSPTRFSVGQVIAHAPVSAALPDGIAKNLLQPPDPAVLLFLRA